MKSNLKEEVKATIQVTIKLNTLTDEELYKLVNNKNEALNKAIEIYKKNSIISLFSESQLCSDEAILNLIIESNTDFANTVAIANIAEEILNLRQKEVE